MVAECEIGAGEGKGTEEKSEIRANKLLEIEIAMVDQRLGPSQDEASKPHRETPV
jgi:hypothetical protein